MTEPTGSAGGPGREPGGDGDDPFAGLFRDQPGADPRARGDAAGRPGGFGADSRWGGPAAQPWTPEPDRGGFGAASADAPGGPDGPGSPSYPNQPFPVNQPTQQGHPTQHGQQGQPTQQVQRPLMHAETGINPIVRADYPDEDDYRSAGWEPSGAQEPKRGKKKALVATGALGTVAVVGAAVVLLTQGGGVSPGASGHPQAAPTPTPTVGFAPTGATSAENAAQTAQVFFRAWESGDFKAAANYTDDPTDALTELQTYQTDLGASSLTITPTAAVAPTSTPTPSTAPSAGSSGATATGTSAPSGTQNFSVSVVVTPPAASGASESSGATTGATAGATSSATGAGAGASASATSGAGAGSAASSATWTYSSNLTAYQQGGRWYVKWDPSVLAPNLTTAEHLATVPVQPGAGKVTDANGGNLANYSDPGIQSIVSYLKQHVPAGEGTPGVAVELVDSAGKAISGTEDIIKPAVNATAVATTIDPQIEQLALHAVQHKSGSSMVVIRPSTGAILAVANNDGGKDDALASREAPGSTMKIVTAAALFNYGVLTPSSPVACPPLVTIQGVPYHNSEGDQEPAGTPFLIDFAQSCNNAFDSQYTNLGNLRLEGTAAHTFGLNQPWNIGLGSASYFNMPTDSDDESGSELAQEAFGQGKVSASPLAMASVAATVDTGQFHQPYLLTSITDKVTEGPMPSTTQADLKKVMRAVIANPIGTAFGIPFASDVYGKTGTAEHGPANMSPNAWFTAVDPNHDIAACALVLDNTMNQDNYGATNAAPEVLTVFNGL